MNKKNLLIDHHLKLELFKNEIKKILKNNSFSRGRNIEIFKKKIKEILKVKYVFLTSSCTTALSTACSTLELKNNDRIAVSDFSWISTAHVIHNNNCKPIFVDVDKDTFNMSLEDLKAKFSKKIKALIFVDTFGNCSNILKIKNFCKKNKIILIQDSACSFGGSFNGRYIGNFADITCFSFQQRKLFTTAGEGGAIVTNNKFYAKKIEKLLNLGALNFKNRVNIKTDFDQAGFNYRMTEIQALFGWKQLEFLKKKIKLRNIIFKKYINNLGPLGFNFQKFEKKIISNVQSVVAIVPKKISRDKLLNFLRKNKIDSVPGYFSLSDTIFYKTKRLCKNSIFLKKNSITLPCHENIDQKKIIRVIKKYVQ